MNISKKFLALLCAILMLVSVVACAKEQPAQDDTTAQTTPESTPTEEPTEEATYGVGVIPEPEDLSYDPLSAMQESAEMYNDEAGY